MKRDTVKKIQEQQAEQPAKKAGLWARFSGWVKGLFSSTAEAVGKVIPERAKKFAASSARRVVGALRRAYNYVVPTMHRILRAAVAIFVLATTLTLLLLAPMAGFMLLFALVGGFTLFMVGWAYLEMKAETRPWARTALKVGMYVTLTVGAVLEVGMLTLALSAGVAQAIVLIGLMGFAVYLNNEAPRIDAYLARRRAERLAQKAKVAAEAPVMGPQMPVAATH